jgi:hypothetical protein
MAEQPAEDEAELVERMAKEVLCDGIIICHNQKSCLGCFAKADAALAAIRAAGWAVVPGWQPIETAPKDTALLLFCPDIGIANRERIELGQAVSTFGRERGWSIHAWAAAWMPLPAAPGVKP